MSEFKRHLIDELIEAHGVYRLTACLQKRVREIVTGSPTLVDTSDLHDPLDVALREIKEGRIRLLLEGEEDDTPRVVKKE
ncbi:MAG: DNA-directed RNA polymerase subunit omega [Planctomycetes bacterium]|nr:DNA-directed RNA polymerase subunit omega [Planctomycetota bacterium]